MAKTRELLQVNLKRLRKAAGFTQESLADALGISSRGFQKYEQGETWPEPEMLDDIARKLNCSVSDLISDNSGGQSEHLDNISRVLARYLPIPSDIIDHIAKAPDFDFVRLQLNLPPAQAHKAKSKAKL